MSMLGRNESTRFDARIQLLIFRSIWNENSSIPLPLMMTLPFTSKDYSALLSHNFSEQRKVRIYNGFSHLGHEIIVENFV